MNVWKIEKNTTELFQKDSYLREPCDVPILKKILKSDWNYTYEKEYCDRFNLKITNARAHIRKIIKECKDGYLVAHPTVKEYGRATFKGQTTLALLPCELRQVVAIKKKLTKIAQTVAKQYCFSYVFINLNQLSHFPLKSRRICQELPYRNHSELFTRLNSFWKL